MATQVRATDHAEGESTGRNISKWRLYVCSPFGIGRILHRIHFNMGWNSRIHIKLNIDVQV